VTRGERVICFCHFALLKEAARDHRMARPEPLLEAMDDAGCVVAWFAGHDHDLQHLRSPSGLDVFVSGNGSRWRDERFRTVRPGEARLFFASTAWGFAVLEAWPGGWSVRFEDAAGAPLHCCRASFPGPCEPAPCGARLR
jgi:hypothetical protein